MASKFHFRRYGTYGIERFLGGPSTSPGGGLADFPVGAIIMMPGPGLVWSANWLLCQGQILIIADYPDLWAHLSTTYGGDGITTFGLPDLRGEFVRGVDNGRGKDPGRTLGSNQANQNKAHTHQYGVWQAEHDAYGAFGTASALAGSSYTTTSSGGSESRPENIAVWFLIKALAS